MRLFVLLFALAWPAGQASAAACGTVGLLINGFDAATSACTGTSEVSAPIMAFKAGNPANVAAGMVAVSPAAVAGITANIQGDHYGRMTFAAATYQRLTVTSANFAAGVGTDFSTRDFLYFAYASTFTAGTQFTGEYYLINGAATHYYTAQGGNVTRVAYAAATDWTLLILSINYARNLGFPPDNIASVSIGQKGAGAFPAATCYDNLTLANGTDIPNSPVVPGNVAAAPSCGAYNVTITPNAVPGGTDPIFGYHIYRSTVAGGLGPYTSYKYLTNVSAVLPAAFTEVGPFTNTSVYYKVLPYSVSTTAFGGSTGYFVLGGNSGMDPQNSSAKGGVHEALLSAATALGPIDQTSGCPTNTSTSTPTQTPTNTITPSFTNTSTATPTRTVSPTSTHTATATATGTSTSTSTSTATPTSTNTSTSSPTPTCTSTITPLGPSDTNTPSLTVSPTCTQSASATQSASITPSGTPTSTPTATASATQSASITPSGTFTSTSTATPSATATATASSTSTSTATPTETLVSTSTDTPTISPTSTITQTWTASPVLTATPKPSGTQLFPNPFHPDQGETFHLGNVKPSLRVNIYNIIGEFVIGFTTKGNPTEDRWDGLNANGVRVVTGIYFLQIDGQVYRVAVVRN